MSNEEEKIRQELINDFHTYVKKKYIEVEYDINELTSNNGYSLVFSEKKYEKQLKELKLKKEMLGEFVYYIEKYLKRGD